MGRLARENQEGRLRPVRDHFRPPLDDRRPWEGFHATWPVMIVALLRRKLPRRYFAEPRVHPGSSAEIDVAAWALPRPTLVVDTDLPAQDVYEVRVYDEKRHSRLVVAMTGHPSPALRA